MLCFIFVYLLRFPYFKNIHLIVDISVYCLNGISEILMKFIIFLYIRYILVRCVHFKYNFIRLYTKSWIWYNLCIFGVIFVMIFYYYKIVIYFFQCNVFHITGNILNIWYTFLNISNVLLIFMYLKLYNINKILYFLYVFLL